MVESDPISNPEPKDGRFADGVRCKKANKSFCSLLLHQVTVNGMDTSKMAKELKMSRQGTQYWLKKLKLAGIVNQDQSHPFAIYSLTPLGEQVQTNLAHSEKQPLWRCHAQVIGSRIEAWGQFGYRNRRKVSMNNWNYVIAPVRYKDKKWNIHIQENGLAKIYCPPVYCVEPDTAFVQATETAVKLFERMSDAYGMRFSPVFTVREGHKELLKSDMLARVFGKSKVGNVWIDASEGTDCLEETASENRLERLLALGDAVPELNKHLTDIHNVMLTQNNLNERNITTMSQFSEQIRLHLGVLTKMSETLDKIQESLKG